MNNNQEEIIIFNKSDIKSQEFINLMITGCRRKKLGVESYLSETTSRIRVIPFTDNNYNNFNEIEVFNDNSLKLRTPGYYNESKLSISIHRIIDIFDFIDNIKSELYNYLKSWNMLYLFEFLNDINELKFIIKYHDVMDDYNIYTEKYEAVFDRYNLFERYCYVNIFNSIILTTLLLSIKFLNQNKKEPIELSDSLTDKLLYIFKSYGSFNSLDKHMITDGQAAGRFFDVKLNLSNLDKTKTIKFFNMDLFQTLRNGGVHLSFIKSCNIFKFLEGLTYANNM